jgi:hypothetical protein
MHGEKPFAPLKRHLPAAALINPSRYSTTGLFGTTL